MGRAWMRRARAWGLLARLPAGRARPDDQCVRTTSRRDTQGLERRQAAPEAPGASRPVQAIVRVRLAPSASRPDFERYLRTIPAVLSAWQVAGDVDYELRLACEDIAGLDAVLTAMRRRGSAEGTTTGLVLREVPGLGELDFPGPSGPGTAEWRTP
jgi:DNA-binding Lrp family transcriptional regulator